MAAGCPVIVTPEVGVADIVQETGAGRVVNGDPVALGNGISKLLANPQLLREMGKRGRNAVEERFTWDAVAQRMESVYQEILAISS
jgi:glycosyltransferase involved in cell wall biosynthesis